MTPAQGLVETLERAAEWVNVPMQASDAAGLREALQNCIDCLAALTPASPWISAIPASALCFFKDGDSWVCVHGDFINLQESPAGFGDSFDTALDALAQEKARG